MRYDAPWVTGALVYGGADLGVLGSVIRATTGTGPNGAGILYNDWDSSADDGKAFRALIVSGAPAGAVFNEDGSFSIPGGTADGTYVVTYRLFVDGADLGTSPATITVGAGGTTFSVAPAGLASTLAYGVPTVTFTVPNIFSVAPAGLPSGAAYGAPVLSFFGGYSPDLVNARRLVVTMDPRLQGTSLPGSGGPFLQPYPFAPGCYLDLEVDWRQWLEEGDSLASFVLSWGGDPLGDLDNEAEALGVVSAWLRLPPDATLDAKSNLLCAITTAAGRKDSRKYELLVKQL